MPEDWRAIVSPRSVREELQALEDERQREAGQGRARTGAFVVHD